MDRVPPAVRHRLQYLCESALDAADARPPQPLVAQRFAATLRDLAKAHDVTVPAALRARLCGTCWVPRIPGASVRVRTAKRTRRSPASLRWASAKGGAGGPVRNQVVTTCLVCGAVDRAAIPRAATDRAAPGTPSASSAGTWDVAFFSDVCDGDAGDTLDLSRRDLDTLSLPRGLIGMYDRLQTLDVSRNRLRRLPREVFEALPRLRRLDCSRNLLERLEPGAGVPLPATLTRVDASRNRVKHVGEAFAACRGLRALSLAENLLQTVAGLEGLSKLVTLDVGDNRVRSPLGFRLLCFNKNLRRLRVAGNPLSDDENPRSFLAGVAPQVDVLDGEAVAPGVLGNRERALFYDSPPRDGDEDDDLVSVVASIAGRVGRGRDYLVSVAPGRDDVPERTTPVPY